MSGRHPTGEAVRLLQEELQRGRAALPGATTEDVWHAFVRFGRRRFDTPGTPDADGLLLQYGTHSFDGPARFTLDLTRQFEVNTADGDHHHFEQLHCELRYDRATNLRSLGSFQSWFFHDGADDLDGWAEELADRAAWSVLRELRPEDVRVYPEEV